MNKNIDRREFLRTAASAAAVTTGAVALGGCKSGPAGKQESTATEVAGEMEYRINPNSGDKVSLLGYGCMR